MTNEVKMPTKQEVVESALKFARSYLKLFVSCWCFLLAFRFLNRHSFGFLESAIACAFFALAGTVFATMGRDEQVANTKPANAWEFILLIIDHRRYKVVFLLGATLTLVVIGWRLIQTMVAVEFTGSSGFLVKLPGQTVYYEPVSPYGWQETRIKLNKGDSLSIEMSGRVSPGYLRNYSELENNLADLRLGTAIDEIDFQWPFTGPEGYPDEWYEVSNRSRPSALASNQGYSRTGFINQDSGLTVQGLPHNRVIGIILPIGVKPRRFTSTGSANYKLFDNEDPESSMLIQLSSPAYPVQVEANRSGVLWVNINDSDLVRWDNAGMFFLKASLWN